MLENAGSFLDKCVRIYNLGFTVFSIASVFLALDPYHSGKGAMWLVIWRLLQGVGGAMLFANSSAIIADAFPATPRGLPVELPDSAAKYALVMRGSEGAAEEEIEANPRAGSMRLRAIERLAA